MCLLLETIKVEDGQLLNLEYHNRRFNESRRLRFGTAVPIDLGEQIHIPHDRSKGVFRCRVLYREKIEEIRFARQEARLFESLKLIVCDKIDYSLKYADRTSLLELYEQRDECDEILIVRKGFITDTSISNVILRKRDGKWVTPDTFLLNGTMRMFLLDSGKITEETVRVGDLYKYTGARMINCMMGFDTSPLIGMHKIHQ